MSNQNKNQNQQKQNQPPQMMQEPKQGQAWIVPAVVGAIAVLLIIGGISYARRGAAPASSEIMATSTDDGVMAATTSPSSAVPVAMNSSDAYPVAVSPAMNGVQNATEPAAAPAMVAAVDNGYQAYSFELMSLAKSGKKVALFFYGKDSAASIALDADIRAHRKDIPPDTLILELYADESPILSSWYSVPATPYVVQIDSKGQAVGKWANVSTLAEILANVK